MPSTTVPIPPTAQAGDFLILAAAKHSATTVTVPAGWTALPTGPQLGVWYRHHAGASEPSTVVLNSSGPGAPSLEDTIAAAVVVYDSLEPGVATVTSRASSAASEGLNALNPYLVHPGLAPTVPHKLVAFFGIAGVGATGPGGSVPTIAPPPGMVTRLEDLDTSGTTALLIADEDRAEPGATGSRWVATTGVDMGVGWNGTVAMMALAAPVATQTGAATLTGSGSMTVAADTTSAVYRPRTTGAVFGTLYRIGDLPPPILPTDATNAQVSPAAPITLGVEQSGVSVQQGYTTFQAFMEFDTSAIPTNAQIKKAFFRLELASITADAMGDVLELRRHPGWGTSLDLPDWLSGPEMDAIQPMGVHAITSPSAGPRVIEVANLDAIEKGGITQVHFASARQRLGTPMALSTFQVQTGWTGSAFGSSVPILVVTYETAAGVVVTAAVSLVAQATTSASTVQVRTGATVLTGFGFISIFGRQTVVGQTSLTGAASTITSATPTLVISGTALMVGEFGATATAIGVTPAAAFLTTAAAMGLTSNPPPNDDFYTPTLLTEANLTGTLAWATRQTGEPNFSGFPLTHTVWYRWTAPRSGRFVFDLKNTLPKDQGVPPAVPPTYPDLLADVFTGVNIESLTLVAAQDDDPNDFSPKRTLPKLEWDAVSGTTYHIRVAAFPDGSHSNVVPFGGTFRELVAVSMVGRATVTPSASQVHVASASLTGGGTITAHVLGIHFAEASLTGRATLTAEPYKLGAASLTARGFVLSVLGTYLRQADIILRVTASIIPKGERQIAAKALLVTSSDFYALGGIERLGATTLTGRASLSITSSVDQGGRNFLLPGLRIAHVIETEDGQDFPVVGSWEAYEEAPGGYLSAVGRVSKETVETHPRVYKFGAKWRTFDLETGDCVFSGKLLDPQPSRGGYAVMARGPAHLLSREVRRLLYATNDLTDWGVADAEPYNYALADKMETRVQGRRIVFKVGKDHRFEGLDYERTAAVFWHPTGDLRSIDFKVNKQETTDDYRIRVWGTNGPSGTLTTLKTIKLDGFDPADQSVSLEGWDQVLVGLIRTPGSSVKSSKSFRAWITDVAVYGIAKPSWTTSDIARDIAARTGLRESLIRDTDTDVLPADFKDGSHLDALVEMGLLDDFRPLVLDFGNGPILDYGPWDTRVWYVEDPDATVDLEPLDRYNQVRVPYRMAGGVESFLVSTANPNPFPHGTFQIYDLDLDDPLPKRTTAKALGEQLVEYLVKERAAGGARITWVRDKEGNRYPAHVVHAGDIAVLVNYGNRHLRVKALRRLDSRVELEFDDSHAVIDRWKSKRKRRMALGVPQSKATLIGEFSPDNPSTPTGVTATYLLREQETKPTYNARASWDAVTTDVLGAAAGVITYEVQLQAVDASGNRVLNENGNVEPRRKKVVGAKDDADPADPDSDTNALFRNLERPRRWYYQVRVRAVGPTGKKSTWSAWTAPQQPADVAKPKPPTPSAPVLNFHKGEADRANPWAVNVKWSEVGPWDVPGGDKEDDVDRYQVQLVSTDVNGTLLTDSSGDVIMRKKSVASKDEDAGTFAHALFRGLRFKGYYKARVRAIDRFNRKSDWSNYSSVGSASDQTPPDVPTLVVFDVDAHKAHFVWDYTKDGTDVGDDLANPKVDVDYFQVILKNPAGTIIRADRIHRGTSKHWRLKKTDFGASPTGTFTARVRAVDASGNKSAWLTATGNRVDPPTMAAPTITVTDTDGDRSGPFRVLVTYTTTSYNDDDIERYAVQLQTSENATFNDEDRKRLKYVDAEDPHKASWKVARRKRVRARVRAIDRKGHKGIWSPWSATVVVTLARTVPAPTNVAVDKSLKRVGIRWKRPKDGDGLTDARVTHFQAELWQGGQPGAVGATLVEQDETQGTSRRWVKEAGTGPYTTRVRTVDEDGNVSAWEPSTAPNQDADASFVDPGSLDDTHFRGGFHPVESVSSLPSLPHSRYPQGRVVYLTADRKLYRSAGSFWEKHINTDDLSGQITSTQIQDGSISTPKIQTNAITANEILAGAVGADEIAANTIVAGHIQSSQIDTERLHASAITSKHTIVGARIATGLSGARIEMNAILGENDRIRIYGTDNNVKGRLYADSSDAVFDTPFSGRAYVRLETGTNKARIGWLKAVDAMELPVGSPGAPGDIGVVAIYKESGSNRVRARFADGTVKQFRFWEDGSA